MMNWENIFAAKIMASASADDPAHDLLHFKRVVAMAKDLCQREGAKFEVVVPAAWFHDLVNVPKNSPLRSHASRLSAKEARVFLTDNHYPAQYIDEICHAIEAHSFSAAIEATTIEAQIVQDADRLDGLGAIGIARCFATSGLLKRAFYDLDDPFCRRRAPDDSQFTVDHFYKKLFRTAETLKTASGREEGQRRVATMRSFLASMGQEIRAID